MARLLALVALVAIAVTGAHAADGTYSGTPSTGVVNVGAAPYMDCKPSYLGGASSIAVSWSNFNETADGIVLKLCYTKAKVFERPWRKFVNTIDKSKQCWQTAKMSKFFQKGVAYSVAGNISVPLPTNTAPSDYTVQVLSSLAGKYVQWGDSVKTSCAITTHIYENQPASLKGTQAFFAVFSIVVLVVAYGYDRSKQA